MPRSYSCDDCGFASSDIHLVERHSCDVAENGGVCIDYPCCGHEMGDCQGLRYGSDEKIKADVERAFRDPVFADAMERQALYEEMWR